MPVSKFDCWFNHYMEQPWGYEYELTRHAELCTYIYNGLFRPKNPVKPSDFYPVKPSEENTEDVDMDYRDIKAILKNRFS